MASARALGERREKQAKTFLRRRGLRIVETNFNSRFGELDIIATEKDCLVFVEVRYRAASQFGDAAATVDTHKQRRLSLAAQGFLAAYPRFASWTCRFDVIGIDDECITWLRDAFRPI